MYKITKFGISDPICDSYSTNLFGVKLDFNSHLLLWKDDVFIGKISITQNDVCITLDNNEKFLYSRALFEDMFRRNAQIIELIFRSDSVEEVILKLKNHPYGNISTKKLGKAKNIRLYMSDGEVLKFYGDLYYWKKKK